MRKKIQYSMLTLMTGMLLGSNAAEANGGDLLWGGIVGAVLGSGVTMMYDDHIGDRGRERLRYFPRRVYPPHYRAGRYRYPLHRSAAEAYRDHAPVYRYHPPQKVKKHIRKIVQKPKKAAPVPVIPLRQSLSNAQKVQKALHGLGLYTGTLDGELHSYQTETALQKFYQKYGMEARTMLDRDLKRELITIGELFLFDQALIARSHTATAQIKQLQTALKIHGYYSGGIDGIMGRKTRAAIVSYKKKKYLEDDPYLDLESKYHLVTSAKRKNRQAIERIIAKFGQAEKPYVERTLLSHFPAQSM